MSSMSEASFPWEGTNECCVLIKTIASFDLFFFLVRVDMMIQTVVDLHSRCFLVMLLILMARSVSFIQLLAISFV